MSSVNKVILIGYAGADAEVRQTSTGKSVADVRIATSEKYGESETTEWHRLIMWEKLAEIAGAYIKKGTQIYVEGRLQTRSYPDSEGVTKYVTEIVVRELRLLGKAGDTGTNADAPADKPAAKRGRKPKAQPFVAGNGSEAEIPF